MSKSFKNPNFYIDSSDIVMDDNGTTLDNFTHLRTFTSLSQIELNDDENYSSNIIATTMPKNSQMLLHDTTHISNAPSRTVNQMVVFNKFDNKQSAVGYSYENSNKFGIDYWHKKPDDSFFWDNAVMSKNIGDYFQIKAYSTDNITMNQTSNLSININIPAPTNYRNIAVTGVSIDNATTSGKSFGYVTLGRYRITSVGATQAQLRFSCYSASASPKLKVTVYILQAKYA